MNAVAAAPEAAGLLPAGLVVPAPEGNPTGGTLYGYALLRALRELGVAIEPVPVEQALAAEAPGALWVDSLYLDEVPALAWRSRGRLGLCLHYLPSLVQQGEAWSPRHLRPVERAALEAARVILVPSPWLGAAIERAGVGADRWFVVEPGVELLVPPRPPPAGGSLLRAVMVANVTSGKGVLPFLNALGRELRAAGSPALLPTSLELVVVGDLGAEPEYAGACRQLIAESTLLSSAVRLAGVLPPSAAQLAVSEADVLVSASRMESYGMALAEAIALGVPILARRGGDAGARVRAAAGGALFEDDASLARELVQLAAHPEERAARRRLAWGARCVRTWREAALDFVRGASFAP